MLRSDLIVTLCGFWVYHYPFYTQFPASKTFDLYEVYAQRFAGEIIQI